VEELGVKHLVGWVRPSKPADWLREPDRPWAVDPLVVDSAFQLVLYWLHAFRDKAALPVGIKSFVQLLPFGPAPVKCTLVLGEQATAGTLTGSLKLEDGEGRLLAGVLEGRDGVIEPLYAGCVRRLRER